jgi:uncharacterized protein YndB with AHSA1/START domain
MAGKRLVVVQAYYYRAPVGRVFRSLTDPKELARWFIKKADLTPRKGAAYRFEWPGGYHHEGEVLEVEPNRRLALSWPHGSGRSRFVSRATFSVRSSGSGTILSLRHTGFPRTAFGVEQYGGTQAGWAYYFLNLRSVLEHGRDLRSLRDR